MNSFNQTPRIIKKYGNRRLYDEADSRYVNFSDLRTLVMEGKQFRVVVEKTNEDQTAKLLLQIFLDKFEILYKVCQELTFDNSLTFTQLDSI
jgi:polyhydroxyalkanoate synthesis repressor PhaR